MRQPERLAASADRANARWMRIGPLLELEGKRRILRDGVTPEPERQLGGGFPSCAMLAGPQRGTRVVETVQHDLMVVDMARRIRHVADGQPAHFLGKVIQAMAQQTVETERFRRVIGFGQRINEVHEFVMDGIHHPGLQRMLRVLPFQSGHVFSSGLSHRLGMPSFAQTSKHGRGCRALCTFGRYNAAMTNPPLPATPSLPDAIDPAALHRVLIIKLRHHGDVLLTSPVLSCLKAAAPQCEIDALVFADTAAMLAGHPALTRLHTIGRDWKKLSPVAQLRLEWSLLQALRARHYDLVIHLTDHPRGAWLTRLLAPRWAVAPRRAGKWWKKSFTHLYRTVGGGRRHTVDTHLDALRRLGIQPAADARRLQLVPGAEAEAKIDTLLAEHSLERGRFIQLHPASRWFFKCWPARLNAQLLQTLAARGEKLVITAAPDAREQEMVEAIIAEAGVAVVNLAGQFNLRELAALTARAKLFVGVDSAPMHIAAAVGTPCVALFGPSGDKEWGPWLVRSEIVTSTHSCRPCGQDGCGGGKVSECLYAIGVEQVLAAIDRTLV